MPFDVDFTSEWSPRPINAVEVFSDHGELFKLRMGGLEISRAQVTIIGETEQVIRWSVGYVQTVCNFDRSFFYSGPDSDVRVRERYVLPLCDAGTGCGYWVQQPVKCLPFLDSLSDPGFKVSPGRMQDYPNCTAPWDYDADHTLERVEGYTYFSTWLGAFRFPLAKPVLLRRYDWHVNWACTRQPQTKELTWGLGWGVFAGHSGACNVQEPMLTGVIANNLPQQQSMTVSTIPK